MNHALGFSQVTQYISMGPPGFMSLYQPVDPMVIAVGQQGRDPGLVRLADRDPTRPVIKLQAT